VIGQRPKSQRKVTMPLIARESGANDRLVRPLCAKNLPMTLPEREGWINRDQLHAFSGRSRKPQFDLAAHFQFKDYAQPAGGCCFLTDKNYSDKLRDFWAHRTEKNYELDDIMLLKVGRHLRPKSNFKMIIGREEGENNFLEGYRKQYIHLRILSHTGPFVLIDGTPSLEDLSLASEIAARFSGGREEAKVTIEVTHLDGSMRVLNVKPMQSALIPNDWYVA